MTLLAVSSTTSGPMARRENSRMALLASGSMRSLERTSMTLYPTRYAPMSLRVRCSALSSASVHISLRSVSLRRFMLVSRRIVPSSCTAMDTWSPALSPDESTQSLGSDTVNVDAPVFCTRRTSVFMVLSCFTNILK
jgi:hypothetical protein